MTQDTDKIPTRAGWRRDHWMGVLATASPQALADLAAPLTDALPHEMLRAPEIGAVMTRGRTGATGAPFNLGEMTVTRCALKLPCGTVGHAYVQGRDKAHALRAAHVDALMMTEACTDVAARVLAPLAEARDATRTARAEKAAATKVDFFTLVRGED